MDDIIFKWYEVWTPDFRHWNAIDGWGIRRTFDKTRVSVKHTGVVNWDPPFTVKSSCELNLKDYPFDHQFCNQYYGTWVNNMTKVNLQPDSGYLKDWGIDEPIVLLNDRNHQWKVNHLSVERYEIDNANGFNTSALHVWYHLERRNSLFVFYILLPYLVATFLTLCAFTLDVDSNLRLALSGLSLMILILLSMSLASIVGTHSTQVPYAGE